MRFLVLCYFVLVLCLKERFSYANPELDEEEIAEITETCCSHGTTFAVTASAVKQCIDAEPPDDIEPEQLVVCLAGLRSCCQQHFKLKDECTAGLAYAPAKRCSVPKTDVGKTCCEECTIGSLTGESQGREACGSPAGEYDSPTSSLRKNAYYKCCIEAAEKPTTTEPPPTTTPKKPETTTKAKERCKKSSCDHICEDDTGKVKCSCREGYRLQADKKKCKDINECAEALDDLCTAEGTVCHNVPGSFKCVPIKKREIPNANKLACPPGFKRNVENQVCDDINECQLPKPPCPKYLCENTIGGYKCAGKPGKPFEEAEPGAVTAPPEEEAPPVVKNDICPPGFRSGPDDECLDIDECEEHSDDCQRLSQHCINTHGGFFCQDHVSKRCPPGFRTDKVSGICEDIDECEESSEVCLKTEVCLNLPGAYECKSKISTLPKLGASSKTCQEGTRLRPGTTICDDIDECREGSHLCDQFQNCINTYGGHECQCKNGFQLDPSGSCVDIDECALKLDHCREGTFCLNTVGTYTCTKARVTTSTTLPPYEYEYYDSEEDNLPTDNETSDDKPPPKPILPSVQPAPTRPTPVTSRTIPTTSTLATTTAARATWSPYSPRVTPTTRRPYTSRPRPTPRPVTTNPPATESSSRPTPRPATTTPPAIEASPSPATPHPKVTPAPSRPVRPEERPTAASPDSSRPRRPDYTRPESRPDYNRPETKPEYTRPESRPDYTKPETRPDYTRPETRPDYTRPESRPEYTRPESRPEYTRPESRPDYTRPEPRPTYNRPTQRRPEENRPRPGARPTEVDVPPPENPVTIEKEKDNEGTYDINTSDIPKDRWTNVIGTDKEEEPKPEDFDLNELHCLNGYKKNAQGECVDIDECAGDEYLCSSAEVCVNRPGGYVCECKAGFTRNATGWCEAEVTTSTTTVPSIAPPPPPPLPPLPPQPSDVVPYAPRPRPQPTIPSRPAIPSDCELGYTYDAGRGRCIDIDECATNRANCSPDEECINYDGGYRCVCGRRCEPGLTPSYAVPPSRAPTPESNVFTIGTDYGQRGPQYLRATLVRGPTAGAYCPWGYTLTPDKMCYDIDECAKNVSRCGPQQRCENFYGGHSCQCPAGHKLVGEVDCEDVDECRYGTKCPFNAQCVNTVGSYRCECGEGFRNAPQNDKMCVDVDECAEIPDACEHGCANGWGGYRCYCKKGYRLHTDNRTCVDVDECAEWGAVRLRGRLCGGECVNEPGSFRCACPDGYRLAEDGRSCIDIDECETGEASCAHAGPGTVCQNTRGGYHCHKIDCPPGYRLESRHRCSRIQRQCPMYDWNCLHQPSTYSYNFITFVSHVYLPEGSVALFTMHGPAWPDAMVTFEMRLVGVQAAPNIKPLDLDCFEVRPSNNMCVVSLLCSPSGPQVAELELTMSLYRRSQFAGSAVARLVVIVSQYEF